MFNIFKKKEKETSIRLDVVPQIGTLFVLKDLLSEIIGVVTLVGDNRIIFSTFKDNFKDKDNLFEFIMEDGNLYYINSSREKLKMDINYVKDNVTFYPSSEDQKSLLERMIEYKSLVVIPQKEDELNYHKEQLEKYILLKEKV